MKFDNLSVFAHEVAISAEHATGVVQVVPTSLWNGPTNNCYF